ncbi:hypothetical protein PPYR_03620 [Photinus pyralis]|uniref:Peptidase M13 N-terminal domain-containing protein n=1 Tax=Photinus pyralis TaxID=7054 RepID=A0A5N4A3B6_PHOPY|nr:hypothetical protein PPYR_03620 [Photinus pyralis]
MEKPLATRTRHETYAELVQLAFPNPNDMRKIDDGWCEKPIPEKNGVKTVTSTSVTTFQDSDPNPTIHSSTSELMSELWSKSRKITSDRLNVLHISTIILLILLFIEAIIIIVLSKEDPQACLTPGCIETSFQISHKLDTSVDPCTDFYEFACGNYKNEIILEEHQQTRNIFTDVSEAMYTRIELLFNTSFSGPKHHHILTKLYNLCLDNNAKDVIMIPSIITQLSSWPILEGIKWNPNNFHWTEVMVKSKKLGLPYNSFIQIDVQPNLYNTSKNVLTIDCCTAPLIQAEKYVNETLRVLNLSAISTEDLIQFVTFRNNIMKASVNNVKMRPFSHFIA